MAPKRSEKVVMKTKKKVVEESVKVSVVGTDQGSKETVKVAIEDKTQQSKAVFQVSTKGREVKAPLEERKKNAVEGRKVSTHHQLEGPPKKGRKKTAQGAEGGKEKKGSRKRKEGGYKRYVFKVMKQVHPELGISSNAMTVLNGFMNDMFERLASEAGRLSKYGGKMTLSSREIQGAVWLILPGELGKHAIAEGTKAVTTFNMSNKAVGSRS